MVGVQPASATTVQANEVATTTRKFNGRTLRSKSGETETARAMGSGLAVSGMFAAQTSTGGVEGRWVHRVAFHVVNEGPMSGTHPHLYFAHCKELLVCCRHRAAELRIVEPFVP